MDNATLTVPQALSRAFSAYSAGQLSDAEQLCQQIIDADGGHFAALHLLAIVQSGLGKKIAALASYDRALSLRPDHAEVLCNRGVTLHQLERFEEALASYDRALALRADYPEALSNRGNTLRSLNRLDEALANYDRALAARPDYAEALCNRGAALHERNRFEEAVASYNRALMIRPDYVNALCNRGGALLQLNLFEDALASYQRVLALAPNHAEALSNRGVTLHRLGRLEEALASYDRALAMRPDYAEALCNRGVTLHEMQRFDEALASYAAALAVRPDYAEAHFNEGLCRALTGDYRRGLEKFEWRWQAEQSNQKRNFTQPLWLGSDEIAGRTILLHAEQGFGDTIQFCRYVSLVAARGARVILEVQRPLRRLMSGLLTNGLAGATEIVARGEPLPAFDVHCPLLSLPLAFGSRLESIPSATPYLRAPAQSVTNWKERLETERRPRIGLTWSGGPTLRHRSMKLKELLSLLDVDATFVSLQKEVPSEDAPGLKDQRKLLHFGDELKDFSETAALISHLDLVISVDTSVAHLAGALARPVWVLLPLVPDWRWQLEGDTSPWYPTARLFRQDASRSWAKVIARVQAVLREPRDNR
jgi:tetratricopeptide (TPR) repeat protein